MRSHLAERGFAFNLDYTEFAQGLLSPKDPNGWGEAGRADLLINLDTEKLGLWTGGSLRTHTEYRYGPLPGSRGNALWPVNTGTVLPLGTGDTLALSSLHLTQSLGPDLGLMVGKINTVDLLAADAFFGGWGIRRFQNLTLAAPPPD